MSILRNCAITALLIPTAALFAAEKNPGVTPASLVNQTIPTYGVVNQVPHYTDSRANSLYLEIHQVLAEVESHGMAGKSAVAVPMDTKKKKKAEEPAPSIPLSDARLSSLLSRLVELDARITYRTYLEQWQIDNSFSDLARAAEMQAISGYVTSESANAVQQARAHSAEKAKVVESKPEPKAKPVAAPKIKAPVVPVAEEPTPVAEPVPVAPVDEPALAAPVAEEPAPVAEEPAPVAEPAPAIEAPDVEAAGPAVEAPDADAPAVTAPPEL